MAIVETFFRNSNFVVLLLLLLLLLLLPSPPPPRPPPSPPPPLPPLPCPLLPCQLFANLFASFCAQWALLDMENLSDTYHDPSYKVPKNYRKVDPPKKKIGGVITIRQPTLKIIIVIFYYIISYYIISYNHESHGPFSSILFPITTYRLPEGSQTWLKGPHVQDTMVKKTTW